MKLAITGLYFYACTILYQFIYLGYFNFSSTFIEYSIRDNIVFFYIILVALFSGYNFLIIVVFLLFLWGIAFLLNKIYIKIDFYIFMVILFLSSILFVSFISKNMTTTVSSFHIPNYDCMTKKDGHFYVIPAFYQTKALVVEVDSNTNKMTGEILVLNDLSCGMNLKETGVILR